VVAAIPPGSYACLRTRSPFGWLIRLFTRSQYDHVVIVTGPATIVEAAVTGVREDALSRYAGCLAAADTGDRITDAQRAAIVASALSFTGDEYAWGTILVLALRLAGIRWRWLQRLAHDRDALICSQLAVLAGLAGGQDWGGSQDPAMVTPAYLAARPQMAPVQIT
jgi:hypothetical protein